MQLELKKFSKLIAIHQIKSNSIKKKLLLNLPKSFNNKKVNIYPQT